MKVAVVVGGGILGLSAAWLLAPHHDVTLFESADYLGGHAHTVHIPADGGSFPADTGFTILNKGQYPNVVQLFNALGVDMQPAKMRLAVSTRNGGFEWSSDVPGGIFADKMNYLRPSFWRFLAEIVRFNRTARRALQEGLSPEITLSEFLDQHRFSSDLRTGYVFPIAGSIWSTPIHNAKNSPALSILTFFDRHGMLHTPPGERFAWHTVAGGSGEYVRKLKADLERQNVHIRLSYPIHKILRDADHVTVQGIRGAEIFDMVVVAAHADTALGLLAEPTDEERSLLSTFTYEKNQIYLHQDPSCMPRRNRAWGGWNYLGERRDADGSHVSLTYFLNDILGRYDVPQTFLTLNPHRAPQKEKTIGSYQYAHPVFTPASLHAQGQLDGLQNKHRTLFCGSYFGYGFHEDGITAAIGAVAHLGIQPPWAK
jgi:predicted NAD/FAD-binding protein